LPWHRHVGVRGRGRGADIGRRTEVRNGSRLYFYEQDDPGDVFLLMVGEGPCFSAAGWLEGRELEEHSIDPRLKKPARAAERVDLHPLPLPPDA
jgi:hypothetical protein